MMRYCIRCGKPLQDQLTDGISICDRCRTFFPSEVLSFYRELERAIWKSAGVYGFCRSCGSEWKHKKVFSSCPFCGKPLRKNEIKPRADEGKVSGDIVKSGAFGDKVRYTLDSSGTLTISGSGAIITYYNASPFSGNNSIKKIVIEQGITSIGYSAFSGCAGLERVTIPDSVKSIGDESFRSCTGLTNLSIPHSVTTIGSGAFRNCIGLTNVVIPDSLTSIGYGAFRDCTGLKAIWIPGTMTQIGNGAFEGCAKGLTIHGVENSYACKYAENNSVAFSADPIVADTGSDVIESNNIPDVSRSRTIGGPTEQDSGAGKSNKTILKSGTCGAEVKYTLDIDGTLTVSGKGKMTDFKWYSPPFYNDSSIKTVVIEAGVTSIGNFVFRTCTGLADVTIPASVTSIGDGAFRSCTGLTVVTIPDSATAIGYGAFRDCTGLKRVVIPDSVKRICGGAFRNCTGLKTIWIPETTTQIGNGAFEGCNEDLTIHGTAGSAAQKYAASNNIPFSTETVPHNPRADAADGNNAKRQTMFCIACGATLTDLTKPCPGCGRSLAPEERQFYLRSAPGIRGS